MSGRNFGIACLWDRNTTAAGCEYIKNYKTLCDEITAKLVEADTMDLGVSTADEDDGEEEDYEDEDPSDVPLDAMIWIPVRRWASVEISKLKEWRVNFHCPLSQLH